MYIPYSRGWLYTCTYIFVYMCIDLYIQSQHLGNHFFTSFSYSPPRRNDRQWTKSEPGNWNVKHFARLWCTLDSSRGPKRGARQIHAKRTPKGLALSLANIILPLCQSYLSHDGYTVDQTRQRRCTGILSERDNGCRNSTDCGRS